MSASIVSGTPASDRGRRRNDPAWQQIRVERAIATAYTGRFEWWIVFEAVFVFAAWTAVGLAGVTGWISYWLSVPIASALAFSAYMPLHEAAHRNVHGRSARRGWVNEAVGHLSSIPLLLDHPGHQTTHMAHHAHTNEPGRDPDLIYAGSAFWALGISMASGLLSTFSLAIAAWIPPLRRMIIAEFEKSVGSRAERTVVISRRFQTIAILAMLAIGFAGYPLEVFMFWFLPAQIGVTILGIVFAWLPHHPHNGLGRYTNTRVTLFPGSDLLARGHDRHIVHHMLPRVPHRRIPAVFEKLRPILEARGTRIEGSRAGPNGPKVFLGFDPERVAAIERDAALSDAQPFT